MFLGNGLVWNLFIFLAWISLANSRLISGWGSKYRPSFAGGSCPDRRLRSCSLCLFAFGAEEYSVEAAFKCERVERAEIREDREAGLRLRDLDRERERLCLSLPAKSSSSRKYLGLMYLAGMPLERGGGDLERAR